MSTDSGKSQDHHSDASAPGFARTVVWLLRTQSVLVVLAALLTLWPAGAAGSLAVIAGGGIGIVLTAVAALRVGTAPANAAAMVAAFYRGMALKMVLAVVMFVVVAMWFAAWFIPVLVGYMVTLVAYWIALLRLGRSAGTAPETNNE